MTHTYSPIVMTSNGRPIAAIIDYAALQALTPELDALQALRDNGHTSTPDAWLNLRAELVNFFGDAPADAAGSVFPENESRAA